jgi:NADP-dependent 3-hydroxy acid dehydrogenase YdfG
MTLVESYGPWDVVAGASEGVGSAFATAVAKEGVNVVLLARLPHGPSWMVGEHLRAGLQMLAGMPRNDAVGLMIKSASATMDHDQDDDQKAGAQ